MARARLSVLNPVPLRKIERQTRVCCSSSKYWSTVFAMSDPHKGIARERRHVCRTIHQQIAVVVDPHALPGKRLGRRPFDLFSVRLKLAAVAGAGDDSQFLFPRGQATQVRAYSAQREVPLLRVDD